MRIESPLAAQWFRKHETVDEDAITLRLRPLRWRDRVLYDVFRWAGGGAAVAVAVGGLLLFAAPSEAAHVEARTAKPQPVMAPMTSAPPVLASARFDLDPIVIPPEGEDEDVIIILEDDEEDEEILIFDNSLDAVSAAAMAELHIDLGEHALALQYAIEATEAEPRNAGHQALLGEAHLLAGDRKAARRAFRRARRLRR